MTQQFHSTEKCVNAHSSIIHDSQRVGTKMPSTHGKTNCAVVMERIHTVVLLSLKKNIFMMQKECSKHEPGGHAK
jgi:hypothetical protein